MGAEKACYGCHATDHLVADCPQKVNFKNGNKARKNGTETSDTNEEVAEIENNGELQLKTKKGKDNSKITSDKEGVNKDSNF